MGDDTANGRRITERGLFADIRGRADAPALLFLHGGPGQGCDDFMAVQGDLLSRSVRLIGIDQRGVDRSAALPAAAQETSARALRAAYVAALEALAGTKAPRTTTWRSPPTRARMSRCSACCRG